MLAAGKESSGETPQKAAEDDIETNPRKLPQLRSLNPRGQRQVETTASPSKLSRSALDIKRKK